MVRYIVEAEEILTMYKTRGPLTPQMAYDLILATTDNEGLARQWKIKLQLESLNNL